MWPSGLNMATINIATPHMVVFFKAGRVLDFIKSIYLIASCSSNILEAAYRGSLFIIAITVIWQTATLLRSTALG